MDPVSLLEYTAKVARHVRAPKLEGNGPISRLLFNPRYVRATKFPMLPGIGPVREFELIARKFNRVREHKLVGTPP
jgi:hypothetical protein